MDAALRCHRAAALIESRPAAKINLALAVTGRRPDGYHELSSVFLRVGMCDRLSIRVSGGTRAEDRLQVVGADDLPVEDNLVLRAVRMLRDASGHRLPPLDLLLEKRIPSGAGMAGGSSDAAAAVHAAAEVWGVGVGPAEQHRLALELGADVPFFMAGHRVALVAGIGERLEPLPAVRGEPGLLLVTPPFPVATAAVFRAHDALPTPSVEATDAVQALAGHLRDGLDPSGLVDWAARLAAANDLWPAAVAVEPRLTGARAEVESRLRRSVLLTGSGSTLVALYAAPHEAVDAGRQLAAHLAPGSGWSIAACDTIGPDPHWRQP